MLPEVTERTVSKGRALRETKPLGEAGEAAVLVVLGAPSGSCTVSHFRPILPMWHTAESRAVASRAAAGQMPILTAEQALTARKVSMEK